MAATIAIVGALDTKGEEFRFIKTEIERRGHRTLVVDTGAVGDPLFLPDIARDRVALAAGTTVEALKTRNDRGEAISAMAGGVAVVIRELHDQGKIDGIVGMGGSAGTAVGTSAMRALPVGFPKVMVSTVASGDIAPYVGTKDIVMIPSVVDVAGINRISRQIFARAAGAVCGMVETKVPPGEDKPLITASMFGNTTKAVDQARAIMERAGYELLVFHSTGTGGRTMEGLIADGLITGVLDITTTEWADELAGGVLSAGSSRLDAAGAAGIPQVVVPGCLDMVNFWAPETVPEKYRDRKLYRWNPNITLMRTTVEENAQLGRILAQKANAARGPVSFFLPLKGVSILDSPGNEFWWPEADRALFDAIKAHVRPDIAVVEMDCNINDPAFAEAVAGKLLENLKGKA
ncbi:MAG: Tm-1-like ATP-binding domain-containing protein [candidate division Zixibacteria bacterium]|nr:Tm-1-like ATP-binding domain-containing protein [candidate division Zixibacteria bacterium]